MKRASKHFGSQVTLCLIELKAIIIYLTNTVAQSLPSQCSTSRQSLSLSVSMLGVPQSRIDTIISQVRQKCLSRLVVAANANWKLRVTELRCYLDVNYTATCDLTADRFFCRAKQLEIEINYGRCKFGLLIIDDDDLNDQIRIKPDA